MDNVEIPREKLETLLQKNEKMRHDLKMIISIAGEIMEMIGSNKINAVTILTQAPRIVSRIQDDPEKAAFLDPQNIERLRKDYEN